MVEATRGKGTTSTHILRTEKAVDSFDVVPPDRGHEYVE